MARLNPVAMRLFRRRQAQERDQATRTEDERRPILPATGGPPTAPDPDLEDQLAPSASGAPVDDGPQRIRVSRTLVKSEPEVAQLVSADPRLSSDGVKVTMTEKGFGTLVEIAAPSGGLDASDLERLLDELAVPQKRPFSNV